MGYRVGKEQLEKEIKWNYKKFTIDSTGVLFIVPSADHMDV